ncbi:alpha/beta hydrolase [Zhongshania arctica]|uniref:Alpha/beta hydrolase n=1 Tax=Zhongshania arctica TaxID=3238302 RepID=A0ABV3TYV5_9GAMM
MQNYNYDAELRPYLSVLPSVIDLSTTELIRDFWTDFVSRRPPFEKSKSSSKISIENRTIPGLNGAPAIAIRIYRPKMASKAKLPGIYEIHGGGFVIGDLEMQDAWCANIAVEVGAIVVSVDYRLAPEHPFPAATNDCYAGFCWLFEHAEELGIDPSRIAISGQSAGACLATATTLRARDSGGPKACFQLLEIPVFDDRMETASMLEFKNTPMWNHPNAIWGWQHYLGPDHCGDVSPYAAPARAQDLSGLPDTYISTMEFDPLRDEGIEFALRLMKAGVSVELHSFPGTFHGSTVITAAKVSQRNTREIIESLRNHLAR